MLNHQVLPSSTVGKWALMQAVKKPENGKASTIKKNQKCYSFHISYDWSVVGIKSLWDES